MWWLAAYLFTGIVGDVLCIGFGKIRWKEESSSVKWGIILFPFFWPIFISVLIYWKWLR